MSRCHATPVYTAAERALRRKGGRASRAGPRAGEREPLVARSSVQVRACCTSSYCTCASLAQARNARLTSRSSSTTSSPRSTSTMSLLRSAARRLGFGKYRYWKGADLEGARAASSTRGLPRELLVDDVAHSASSTARRQPVLRAAASRVSWCVLTAHSLSNERALTLCPPLVLLISPSSRSRPRLARPQTSGARTSATSSTPRSSPSATTTTRPSPVRLALPLVLHQLLPPRTS